MKKGFKHQKITQTNSPILLNQSYTQMQNKTKNKIEFNDNRNSDLNRQYE